MAENKMSEVAKLLGVELEEEFKIEGLSNKYKLSNYGLMCWAVKLQRWYISTRVGELLTGEKKIIKLPKPILDDIEKEYLSNIIKPFRYKVKYIIKNKIDDKYEYISIIYRDNTGDWYLNFPNFKKGVMYKCMEIGKRYTVEELGL